ncbi:MAG: hypothetical protein ACKVZJ_13195 [Phycisphaerales bacterium]
MSPIGPSESAPALLDRSREAGKPAPRLGTLGPGAVLIVRSVPNPVARLIDLVA